MNMLTKYIGASVVLALLTSCNDFLDVQPKGQNTEDQMFTTITGYEDAMFGVLWQVSFPPTCMVRASHGGLLIDSDRSLVMIIHRM